MKRGLALLLAAALLAAPASAAFWDVADTAWYAPAVAYVEERGLMNGVSGGAFSPDDIMSRGMLATVLHRSAGSPLSVAGLYFQDIETGTWFIDSVIWCAEHGIVTGTDSYHFSPHNPVTREQVALMLWRSAGWPSCDTTAIFTDGEQINLWSRAGVNWACAAGIITGKPGGLFDPQGWATRAEVAQMLMKYDQWKAAQQQERS